MRQVVGVTKKSVGIDPGANGAIVIVGRGVDHYIILESLKFKGASLHDINRFISGLGDSDVFLESVHSIAGDSGKSSFSFGREVGKIETLLALNHISPIKLPPALWAAHYRGKYPCVTAANNKLRNTQFALNTFFDCLAEHKALTRYHDGIIDAALIAVFGMECREKIIRHATIKAGKKKQTAPKALYI